MSLWEKAELKVERGSAGLHLNLNLSLDLSLPAHTCSGFSSIAVSPRSWGGPICGYCRTRAKGIKRRTEYDLCELILFTVGVTVKGFCGRLGWWTWRASVDYGCDSEQCDHE